MDFSYICRFCGENKKTLKSIFVENDDQSKNDILDKIFYLTSLEVICLFIKQLESISNYECADTSIDTLLCLLYVPWILFRHISV